MFPYGVFRQWRVETPMGAPYDLVTHRATFSLLNGVIYSSPHGVIQLLRQASRIDVALHDKKKEVYKEQYKEFVGVNWNTIL